MVSRVKSEKVRKPVPTTISKTVRQNTGSITKKKLKTSKIGLKSLKGIDIGNMKQRKLASIPGENKEAKNIIPVAESDSSENKISNSNVQIFPTKQIISTVKGEEKEKMKEREEEAVETKPLEKKLKRGQALRRYRRNILKERNEKCPLFLPNGKFNIYGKWSRVLRQYAKPELPENPKKDQPGLIPEKVREAVTALGGYLKRKSSEKCNAKLFSDEPQDVFLQIVSVKVPKTSPREIRVVLPHSLLTDTSEVCLIVADLKKGRRIDHEPTVEHYKQILEEKGVTRISEVISLRQLRTEYEQFEMKRALCNRFDVFLSDSKICQHAVHLLGKTFYRRRKIPIPVNLKKDDLQGHIETALRKTSFRMSPYGNVFTAKVGHTNIKYKRLAENVMKLSLELPNVFPGGWENVKSLMVKGAKTISVPFYVSLEPDHTVKVPVVKPLRPKAARPFTGDLDHYGTVTVHPSGTVVQKKRLTEKGNLISVDTQQRKKLRIKGKGHNVQKQKRKQIKRKRSHQSENAEENDLHINEENDNALDKVLDEQEDIGISAYEREYLQSMDTLSQKPAEEDGVRKKPHGKKASLKKGRTQKAEKQGNKVIKKKRLSQLEKNKAKELHIKTKETQNSLKPPASESKVSEKSKRLKRSIKNMTAYEHECLQRLETPSTKELKTQKRRKFQKKVK